MMAVAGGPGSAGGGRAAETGDVAAPAVVEGNDGPSVVALGGGAAPCSSSEAGGCGGEGTAWLGAAVASGGGRSGKATTGGSGAASSAGDDPGVAGGRRSGMEAARICCRGAMASGGLVGGWTAACIRWELTRGGRRARGGDRCGHPPCSKQRNQRPASWDQLRGSHIPAGNTIKELNSNCVPKVSGKDG
ncbi:uncharacterized PE-PGRS family protein PE_PGRS46-like isoform X1 [Haemorhous mexicanus]|uniref:uncharacterized PE-PGRS family protein PE_PGRS46-like isoform X1 n=1 Tax=Haemorhous mexicanus TaxID=30427 RepID=UPI0028BF0780|nr:uncharacterized PE-PGRS family protein PE_PGRS46-like isoform X1 [Haemorhous mexicanus]